MNGDPQKLQAAPHLPSGGGGGGHGGGGDGDGEWSRQRGLVFFRIETLEQSREKHSEDFAAHRNEFVELRTEIMTQLATIDGKLKSLNDKVGFLGFKAGMWASVLNSLGIVAALLLLYWKIK